MKKIVYLAFVFLTGCGVMQHIPPGYYQPHSYKRQDQEYFPVDELAILYGSCQHENSSEIKIIRIDGEWVGAFKTYIKPGNRKVGLFFVYEDNYIHRFTFYKEFQYTFVAGKKYQAESIVGKRMDSDNIFKPDFKKVRYFIEENDASYNPERVGIKDHEHEDPLVIKDPIERNIMIHDCSGKHGITHVDRPFLKPPYLEIFKNMGFETEMQ